MNEPAYRAGLAEFLGDRLDLGQGSVEELLNEYHQDWMSRSCGQTLLPSNAGDEGVGDEDAGPRHLNTDLLVQQPEGSSSALGLSQNPDTSLDNPELHAPGSGLILHNSHVDGGFLEGLGSFPYGFLDSL